MDKESQEKKEKEKKSENTSKDKKKEEQTDQKKKSSVFSKKKKKQEKRKNFYTPPKALTEEERRENQQYTTKMFSIIISAVLGAVISMSSSVAIAEKTNFVAVIFGWMFGTEKRLIAFNYGLLFGIPVAVFLPLFLIFYFKAADKADYHYKDDEVVDTGRFMSKEELRDYNEFVREKDPAPIIPKDGEIVTDGEYSKNIIMSDSLCRPVDASKLIGNNNIMVVGGAGTGKSRFFIKPNVLQMNASYVITDPSGEMIYSLGHVLQTHGYKIKVFNISDMTHSNCYNPIKYMRDEAGVKMIIECFIKNTTQGKGGGDNQFFVDAEKLLYSACIFYLKYHTNDESRQTFAEVLRMINEAKVDANNDSLKSPLDRYFDPLDDSSLAKQYYEAFKKGAGKTLQSILISCTTRLQPFFIPQVKNLTGSDSLELGSIGDEKTALFIITPQADRTYAFLASMLYSQLFETLYYKGEKQKLEGGSEKLKIPVRCLMDEFANIGDVPEFPSKLATMRKYNISAVIVLQDIAQIESMYQDDWKTLTGNCSTYVFLGTQEPNTLKYFSDMLGQKTIRTRGDSINSKGGGSKSYQNTGRAVMTQSELGRLPADECIIFTQNQRPVRDKKYRYERHPYYNQTADCCDAYGFKYNEMAVYDRTMPEVTTSLIKSTNDRERYLEMRTGKGGKFASDAAVKDTDQILSIVENAHLDLDSFEKDQAEKSK
ncbi:VirD4-like conjugal transfer protein, CD1115 family, partial [Intestinibaculum porci]|uniref:VirD4-like conjugal transfer protein, CD1115 family n=1 Tax=Intestinibaculum porci TaxID=2487118 RepID=UPI00240965A2